MVDTIAEHQSLLRRRGYVWWGKFGQGVSDVIITQIRKQLGSRVPTFAYLASGRTITHKARIADVQGGGGRNTQVQKDRAGVPDYYRAEPCTLWLKFSAINRAPHEATIRTLVRYLERTDAPDLNSSRGIIYVTYGTPSIGMPVKRYFADELAREHEGPTRAELEELPTKTEVDDTWRE